MEQIVNTIAQAQQALQALGVEATYDVDYKIVDDTVMQTFSLSVEGKKVYSKSIPLQETPEEFKQKTLEAKAKVEQEHLEYIAKADDIIATIDEAVATEVTVDKQTKE